MHFKRPVERDSPSYGSLHLGMSEGNKIDISGVVSDIGKNSLWQVILLVGRGAVFTQKGTEIMRSVEADCG